jgi:cytochrome c-type biogenesis protein CcmH
MSPDLRISGVKTVIVSARISASGDAMPASGDLTGSSGPVAVGTRNLEIEINRIVR